MTARRVWAVCRKEFRHILRDPRSLVMALVLPLVMMLLFGVALNLDLDRIPTVVYDADRSAQSRDLVQAFRGSRFFDIRESALDYPMLERAIDSNRALIGIAIPVGYAERVASSGAADVQVIVDGSDSNTASIALGYAESVIQAYALRLGAQSLNQGAGLELEIPVETRVRIWYNNTLESKNYVVPGLIAVILMIVASLLTSLTVAREWETGTMEQLLATPLLPGELVLGKMLAFFAVGVADTIMAVLTGIYLFEVPFQGDVLLLAVSSGVFLCGTLFWGIYLSSLAQNQLMAFQMGMASSFLPAFLLSGFIYVIDSMPPAIQWITRLFPARYFVTIIRAIFQKGVGLEVLWLELLLLTVYSVTVFLLAARALRRRTV